jgi:hypothetical protein
MIRKFKFEHQIYESLNCLPMAARRKLDALGIKISLAQSERLDFGEGRSSPTAPGIHDVTSPDMRGFRMTISGGVIDVNFGRGSLQTPSADSLSSGSRLDLTVGMCSNDLLWPLPGEASGLANCAG